jgi:hypothetical protein
VIPNASCRLVAGVVLAFALAACGAGGDDASDVTEPTATSDVTEPTATSDVGSSVPDDCVDETSWVDGAVMTVVQCGQAAPPQPPADAAPFWMLGVQGDESMNTMVGAFGLGMHDHLAPAMSGEPCSIFVLVPVDGAGDAVEVQQSGDIAVVARVDLGAGQVPVTDAATAEAAVAAGLATSVYTGFSYSSCSTRP